MKKPIAAPLRRDCKQLKHKIYEHLGNGYYRDMRTGKVIDKYLNQNNYKRSGPRSS